MSRPRKFIRVIDLPDGSLKRTKRKGEGREIHGLSFNESNQQYYTIDERSRKRVYHGADLAAAIESASPRRKRPPMTNAEAIEKLENEVGLEDYEITPNLIDLAKETHKSTFTFEEADVFVAAHPENSAVKWFNEVGFTAKPIEPLPDKSKEKLSHCLNAWVDWLIGDETETTNAKDTKRHFQMFIKCVGNLSISEIKHNDFVKYQKRILSIAKRRGWSIKTQKDYHSSIGKVLKLAKRKKRDWDFPNGLLEWIDDWKLDYTTPYIPEKKNKKPITPEDFKKCLEVVDDWAAIDLSLISATTQKSRGRKRQAGIKKRDGLQWAFLLRLMVNCSLDNVDCSRLFWNRFKRLDGKLPFIDYPRIKPKHKTGFAIPRFIPLLPSTLEYLRRWKKYERHHAYVFRTSQGTQYNSGTIYRTFKKIVEDAGTTTNWTPKSLRNVAPSLGKREKLSSDERQAILGHSAKGTNTPYEDDDIVDETFLSRIVNLVGAEYFDYESVNK